MKHIKLYENFKSIDLPNYRVNLIRSDMQEGRYIFTCVDGSWNSFFGVFDLKGLKKLEDAMNTECVFAELSDFISGGKGSPNPAFEEYTTIIVNPVQPDAKYLNFIYRDLEFEKQKTRNVSVMSNPKAGMQVGEEGLRLENFVHGHTITATKSPQNDPKGGDSFRIVLNKLHYTDHHWSSLDSTLDYESAFDGSVGFRSSFLEDIEFGEIDKEEVDPYMTSVIDAGIPQGVIKTMKEIQDIEPKDPSSMFQPDEEEFNNKSGFFDIADEIGRIKSNREYSQQDKIEMIKPLIKQADEILQKWKSRIPDKSYEGNKMWLDTVINWIF
jgi:hypothetical protein